MNEELFRADKDWWNNACLNYMPSSRQWHIYTAGYKKAADLLVKYVEDARRDQDTLVFPIVFLYRQYIELRLKEIIKNGGALLDRPEKFPQNHDISESWKQCRKIIEKVFSDDPTKDKNLDMVEDYIQQFSQKDPFSITFRYPVDKKGKPPPPNLRHINLRDLSEIMENIESILGGVSAGISYYLDDKWEMKTKGLL